MPSQPTSLSSIRLATRLVACMLVLAPAIVAASANARPTASAAAAWRTCPYLWKYDTVVGAQHASCRTAERVARGYMAANNAPMAPRAHRILGFQCKVVWVGHPRSDWYANCRKGKALVRAVPE